VVLVSNTRSHILENIMHAMKKIARDYRKDFDLNPVTADEVVGGQTLLIHNLENILIGNARITVGTQTSHQTRNIRIAGEIVATLRSPRIEGKMFGTPVVTNPAEFLKASYAQ
jgi:hypothetical protein